MPTSFGDRIEKLNRGTALEAGRSRVQFSMGPLGFSGSNRNENLGYALEGTGSRCVRLTTLSPLFANYLDILATSTSWKPKGLSRPVKG